MQNKEKIIGSIILSIVVCIFSISGIAISKSKNNMKSDKISNVTINNIDDIFEDNSLSNNSQIKNESTEIIVEIRGAVEKGGIYYLDSEGRLGDLVEMAGGFKGDVDMQRVPSLASKLKDEALIYIPVIGELIDNNNLDIYTEKEEDNKVININSATKEKLMTIPGIGEVTAQKIIEYRQSNGKFNTKEDIKNVNRIGDKTYENIKDYIDVK